MPFGRQQLALAVEPARIAAERPVAADHAVAGDQHRDMVIAIGRADRADRLGLADRRGDLSIASGFAERILRSSRHTASWKAVPATSIGRSRAADGRQYVES